ncbi:MAG: radical SAM-associated putative lipoprotein [Bacteroidales bacterium]|nr:radical SAM-associated putative lipoprotein [Bacteroidales bacterium]
MKNITIIKRRLLKKVLIFMGVCSAGLMASCCKYGALVSTLYMNVKGTIRSKATTQIIEGIQIEVRNSLSNPKVLTDNNGVFSINSVLDEFENSVNIHISDIDGALNGSFLPKDTVLLLSSDEKLAQIKENIEIKLDKNE